MVNVVEPENMFRLDNQIAVITGGAGGIGEAIGHGLASFGAKVIIADINLAKAEEVAGDLKAKNKASEAIALKVDVSDENSVAALRDQVISQFGTIDILINAQGVNVAQAATTFPVNDWDYLFNVNVRGTMLTCREFGKIMISRKKGKVINVSSIRGIRATFWGGNTGYTATKGAVDMITRSLATEWAPYKINVNAIAPSTIATRFSERTLQDPDRLRRNLYNCPLGRVGQPSDIVGACIFLASQASDFITGQIIYIDGGLTAMG
jgi:NAD(P)-dependent dehydrogenase (short-subunit alcohol dehydrogenase family)